MIVDAIAAKEAWVTLLQRLGFVVQRPFTRMALGDVRPSGMPDHQYAIAGLEIG